MKRTVAADLAVEGKKDIAAIVQDATRDADRIAIGGAWSSRGDDRDRPQTVKTGCGMGGSSRGGGDRNGESQFAKATARSMLDMIRFFHCTFLSLVWQPAPAVPACVATQTWSNWDAAIYCARVVRDLLMVGDTERRLRNDAGSIGASQEPLRRRPSSFRAPQYVRPLQYGLPRARPAFPRGSPDPGLAWRSWDAQSFDRSFTSSGKRAPTRGGAFPARARYQAPLCGWRRAQSGTNH